MGDVRTTAGATFWLVGADLDPNAVTQQVGLNPTRVHRRGSPRRYGTGVYDRGAWVLASQIAPERDLPDHVAAVLDALLPAWEPLKRLTAQFESGLQLVLRTTEANPGPTTLEPYVIRKLAELGAWVDLDMYCLGDIGGTEPIST